MKQYIYSSVNCSTIAGQDVHEDWTKEARLPDRDEGRQRTESPTEIKGTGHYQDTGLSCSTNIWLIYLKVMSNVIDCFKL